MSSKELAPGTQVRYKPNGDIVVLDRRKAKTDSAPFPGWWLRDDKGGLADYVIDAPDSEWEVV